MEERTTEIRRGPPPWYREHWWVWLVVLLLIVAGIIAFFALRGDDDEQQTRQRVTVPNVVGLQERVARATLQERGLDVEVTRQAADEARGVVTEQDPRSGSRLARGARVGLTVSTGPEPIETQTQTQTETQTVTTGPETSSMPDVTGTEYRDAVEQLVEAGLFPDSFPVESAEERETVVAQRPEPGTDVEIGSAVRLDVSLGPKAREVLEVPDLTGQALADALRACAEAGFTCRTVTGTREPRDVVSQRPEAGSAAPGLSQIALSTR
jgi:beta-lactam-binding protein with PASTA domain